MFFDSLEPRRLFVVAFPGAEGFGANATGGRGGDVYHVTNLNNSGAGSLRNGVTTVVNNAPRTIVFDVAGTITLTSALKFNRSNMTVAGQTAPGDGITIRNFPVTIEANNVILRHLRFRLGIDGAQETDTFGVTGGDNVIVDHVSASWSVDETLSLSDTASTVTIQDSYITESLRNSIHTKGPHGYAQLLKPDISASYSIINNLYAHHASRNPRPGTYNNSTLTLDFTNNVIYDWGNQAGYNENDGTAGGVHMNYTGNYLVAGPSTSSSKVNNAFDSGWSLTSIYQSGNKIDGNKNHVHDGVDTGWGLFSGTYTQRSTPWPVAAAATQSADAAYDDVLADSGARPWNRDAVDARVTNEVRTETGQIIDTVAQGGGFPTLNAGTPIVDTDRDGMPDEYELTMGFNPSVANNNVDSDGDGYTNLENYLNGFAVRSDRTRPAVTGKRYSGDAKGLQITFSEAVGTSLVAGDLQLRNSAGDLVPTTVTYDSDTNVGTFRFPATPNGVLPDGTYHATIGATSVLDAAGNALAGGESFDFNVFAGDADGDGAVGFTDLVILAQNYGKTGQSYSQGNVNRSSDGLVDFGDLVVLAQNYGKPLAAPAAITAPASTTAPPPVAAPKAATTTTKKKSVASDVL